jgi:putative addiction module component (TIGR02574 family)
MNERVRKLTEEIRKLSPEEQAALVESVLGDLHGRIDPGIEKAWKAEGQRRWKAYLRGGVKTVPAGRVLAGLGRKRTKAH